MDGELLAGAVGCLAGTARSGRAGGEAAAHVLVLPAAARHARVSLRGRPPPHSEIRRFAAGVTQIGPAASAAIVGRAPRPDPTGSGTVNDRVTAEPTPSARARAAGVVLPGRSAIPDTGAGTYVDDRWRGGLYRLGRRSAPAAQRRRCSPRRGLDDAFAEVLTG
jgi:hypothetical protein